MRLHQIISSNGANRSRKRVGRGRGNGRGKTAGRGHKGQRSRTGGSLRIGFESGHIPLYRKLPRRGFNNERFGTDFSIVNLSDLERVEATEIDRATLVGAGLVRRNGPAVKVLGDGEISRAVTIKAARFSKSARSKIEAAGGTVVIAGEEPPVEADASENTPADESDSPAEA